MDPCAIESPGESPYMFAGNSPVMYIDENGEFKMRKGLQQKYPMLTNLLRNLETLATEPVGKKLTIGTIYGSRSA
jgi:hypothetical protein